MTKEILHYATFIDKIINVDLPGIHAIERMMISDFGMVFMISASNSLGISGSFVTNVENLL